MRLLLFGKVVRIKETSMKLFIASLSVWLFALPSFAGDSIFLGSSTFLGSEIMGEDRPFMVYLPPSYSVSENIYPVIYLLDGDIHRFKGFVGVLESLSTETLETLLNKTGMFMSTL